tara:strand:+ start:2615 stop:2773 length:159 start_codon:yes stop_codon:yes gene_type:complete
MAISIKLFFVSSQPNFWAINFDTKKPNVTKKNVFSFVMKGLMTCLVEKKWLK